MSEKILGYLLLVIGLVIIVFSVFYVYRLFTGQLPPFALFHSSGLSINISQLPNPVEIMSGKEIEQVSNLAVTYLLFTLLINVGYKVSSLGIQLLRPIEVKLQAKN